MESELYNIPTTYTGKCDFPSIEVYEVKHEGVYINHGKVDNLIEFVNHVCNQRGLGRAKVSENVVGWHSYSTFPNKPTEHHIAFRADSTAYTWAHEETHALHAMNQLHLLDEVYMKKHGIDINLKRFKKMSKCGIYKKEFIADIGGMMAFIGVDDINFTRDSDGKDAVHVNKLFKELNKLKGTGRKLNHGKLLRCYWWAYFKILFLKF